jgi:hypothetical protein
MRGIKMSKQCKQYSSEEMCAFLDAVAAEAGDGCNWKIANRPNLCAQVKEKLFRLGQIEDSGTIGGRVRWARFVSNPDGKFNNGRFYYGDEAVEIIRAPEVTSKPAPAPATYKFGPTHSLIEALNAILIEKKQAVMPGPDGKFVLVNFIDQKVEQGIDFGVLQAQADAWREIAECINNLDPGWHQNGKPVESAVKFIRDACRGRRPSKPPRNEVFILGYDADGRCATRINHTSEDAQGDCIRLDAFYDLMDATQRGVRIGREQIGKLTVTDESRLLPLEGFDIEQHRIAAAVAELAHSKAAKVGEWHHFEMRIKLDHGMKIDQYCVRDMKLLPEQEHLYGDFFKKASMGVAYGGAGTLGKSGAGGGSTDGCVSVAAGSNGKASGSVIAGCAGGRTYNAAELNARLYAPYGQGRGPVMTRTEQGVQMEVGLKPTAYSKEPGGHPADKEGDEE